MGREKRRQVAARREQTPLAAIREGLTPTTRSLRRALSKRRTALVLGCKARSLVVGALTRAYTPRHHAAAYAPFADAIAVWTDDLFYGGSLSHLAEVRETAPQPVICVDLVVDPYQVYEARRHGADAMALPVTLLPQIELDACVRAAASLGMECALVVHDHAELQRALATDAHVVVVDNRDLRTLEIDRNTCARLASMVPEDRTLLCMSGIRHRADVLAMRDLVDGFVVATSLMRAPSLGHAVRELAFGRVGVEGIRRPVDARVARTFGATFGTIELTRADDVGRMQRIVGSSGLAVVASLADANPDWVRAAAGVTELAALRLPLDTPPHVCAAMVEASPPGCEVWARRAPTDTTTAASLGVDRVELDFRPGRRPLATPTPPLVHDHPDGGKVVLGSIPATSAAITDELGAWATTFRLPDRRGAPGLVAEDLDALFTRLRGRPLAAG